MFPGLNWIECGSLLALGPWLVTDVEVSARYKNRSLTVAVRKSSACRCALEPLAFSLADAPEEFQAFSGAGFPTVLLGPGSGGYAEFLLQGWGRQEFLNCFPNFILAVRVHQERGVACDLLQARGIRGDDWDARGHG